MLDLQYLNISKKDKYMYVQQKELLPKVFGAGQTT